MKKFTRVLALLTTFLTLQISAIAAITINVTRVNVTCRSGSNGSINLTPTGGVAPYSYIWSSGPATQNRTGLTAGNYQVTVLDNGGSSATATIAVTEPAAITLSKSITSLNCGGGSTGAINITVGGGVGAYTYAWNDFVYTEDRSNLTAAVYYVTVTDANGCVKIDSANVTQPSGLLLNRTVTNVTCGSGANGGINITTVNGTSPYTYLWNDGVTTEDRLAIAAGTYSVTALDAFGCSASASATITQSGAGMAINTTNVQPSCNGGSNGTITVTSVIGSVGPYTYRWNDAVLTQNRTGISMGAYSVTATSTTGCTASASINISQPTVLSTTLVPIALTCFGSNNGAINNTPAGGTSPYTYNWGGGIFTKNRTGLSIGTYTVTVTDSRGCTVTASAYVPEPLKLVATSVPSPLACTGGPTGSVVINVIGGVGAYSYVWSAGGTTQNLLNTNAGTYTVTVTDGNGCTAVATATIPSYSPINLTSTQTNIICFAAATGAINLTPANGLAPYNYNWSNGATSQDVASVLSGTYSVTVTDNHGCTASRATTITQPAFGMTVNGIAVEPTCNGGTNGTITIAVNNGNAPYTFNWGGSITSQNRTNLSVGTYNLTVTDNLGCTASNSTTLAQPTPVVIVNTSTNANCFGASTGAINLSVSGGFAPYSYNWGGSVTTQNRTGLAAGTYNVTVTDNRGCTASATSVVGQSAAATVAPTVTNITCNGLTNGIINLTTTGGTAPYTYNWGGSITTQNRINLGVGNYNVTVQDNAGCSYTASASVSQPAAITVSSVITNASCFGGNNGSITTSTTGGTAPYAFNWGGGINTTTRNGLSAGSYMLTVTDNAGCTTTNTSNVSQATALIALATVTNASCNGGTNGAITLAVSGATAPYTFNWGSSITTQNRVALAAGSCTVTITDNAGCTVSNSSNVTQPSSINIAPFVTNATCNGGNNGAINLTVTGGTSPFTYNWGGVFTQNRTTLNAGAYNVTVTDNASCTATATATVGQSSAVTASAALTHVSCNGGTTGIINLTVSGGTGAYTFNWGSVTTQNRTALAAGAYAVTITDANLCTATLTSTINQTSAITASSTTTNVACNGGTTGSINLTVAGGSAPYSFNWGSVSTQNRTNLTAGTYTVTITDNAGCTATHSATIVQTTSLSVTLAALAVTCNGGNNGTITSTVTGGNMPYTYVWNSGAVTANRTALTAGANTLTVTDNTGCWVIATSTVTEPVAIATAATVSNVSCAGGNNGSISLAVTGGTSPYTFNWGAVTTQNRTALAAGSYNVTVTDNAGCTATSTSVVNQNASLSIANVVTNVSCNGGSNGTINITSTGGTAPYTYNWGASVTSQNRTNLIAGTYTVTVLDNAGCSGNSTSTITQPALLLATTSTTNVSCNGSTNGTTTANVTGGTAPYNFIWNTGQTSANRTNLSAATYTVTISDANSCTTSTSATVTEPSVITLNETHTNVTCFAGTNGTASLNATGGTGAYTYNWSNGATTQNVTALAAATYSVTVRDANLCSATSTVTLTQATVINSSSTVANATCNGSANGSIDLSATGGAGTYTYLWNNNATTQDINNLVSATYSVTITDANLCTATSSATISQANSIVLTASQTNVTCFGAANGTINLNVVGGNAPYQFNWNGGATTQNASSIPAGNYSVIVTDNNSCSASQVFIITQPQLFAAAPALTQITCNGAANGSIMVAPQGGTAPYTFMWNNSSTNASRTALGVGSYSVTVTDNQSCSITASATITEPVALALSTTKTDINCNGQLSGSVDLTVTGGTTNFTYLWNNNMFNEDLASVGAATYVVTVTDANGCTATTSATVNQPSPLSVNMSVQNASCNGGNNGSLTANVTGGNGGYIFNWSNGATTAANTNLVAGNYSLSLSDAQACATTLSFNVTNPSAMVLTETHTNVSCNGSTNGAVDLSVSGGAPGYTYTWNNSTTTQDLTGVQANIYTVIVRDANNCTASLIATVIEPNAIALSATVNNVLCNAASTGALTSTVTGGIAPYSYRWINNATTANLINLVAGTYSITVTDNNTCTASTSATITEPSAIVVSLAKTDATCFGDTSGKIVTTVNGGTGAHTYNWSNQATSQNLNNLAAATYTVTIRDSNACSVTATSTINQPSQITASALATNVSCNGGSNGAVALTANGGNSALTFAWSNASTNQNLTALVAATYTVTVADANACSVTASATITQPSALSATETHTSFACSSNPGSIDATISGGTTPYSYLWSNGRTTQDISNLTANTYSLQVSDANNCTASVSATITMVTALSSSLTKTDVVCNGNSTGAINLNVTGGTAPFNFAWTGGASTEDLANVLAGSYSVVVRDANNCTVTNSAIIAQPQSMIIVPVVQSIACFGGVNGAVSTQVSGGNAPYTFAWSNAATTSDITNLPAGTYTLTVTDAANCVTTSANYVVIEPSQLALSSAVTNVSCVGKIDGAITIAPVGGVPPYTYAWSDHSQVGPSNSNLAAGAYTVSVTDFNGCTVSRNDDVALTSPISIQATVQNTACAQVQNGAITLNVSGGTASYTFDWATGETADSINELAPGAYSVKVTDNRGCEAQRNFTISTDYTLTVQANPSTTINLGESVELTATASADHSNVYSWTPAQYVNCATCQTTEATPTYNTLYTVSVIDQNGCNATDTVTINVNSITDLFIPNAFSPNADGNNDVMKLYGDISAVAFMDFSVFNRWGEKVFESSNANFEWDGTYKGQIVPLGVYIYAMKVVFINGYSRNDYKGSITIIK